MKIKPSALVSKFEGRLQGSVGRGWKGINYLANRTKPANKRRERQQEVRGIMNNLAGLFNGLSDTLKLMWNDYASQLPKPMSGINAYIKLNVRLLTSGVIALTRQDNPPLSVETPTAPTGFAVTSTDATHMSLAWTGPTDADLYIQFRYSAQSGYTIGDHPSWTYLGAATASTSPYVHTHQYPEQTRICYQARVIDSSGRVSPWSAMQCALAVTPGP